ncbi:MAG: hypothetical protein WC697_03430 [Patescibacteria group bacterium]|jgi:hypothetical protein
MEKELLNIQMALFFKNEYVGNFESLSLKIKEKVGEPQLTQHLPVPQNIPPDVPRLILKYLNFDLNISKSRIDFFSKNTSLIKENILIIIDILENAGLKIGRVGFVKNFFSGQNVGYLKTLLNEQKISGLDFKEIGIRINTKSILDSFECNNIQNIVNGKINSQGEERDGIVITRDINTALEKIQEYNFTRTNIVELIENFDKKSNELIYV